MDAADYLAALRSDAAALATAARLGLDAPVPSCPGWSVADLVRHTGRVHHAVAERVRTGALERGAPLQLEMPPGAHLAGWLEEGAEALARVLAAADPDAPAWNWSVGPQRAGFWPRRMAQETAVHRWDGQAAHGRPESIEAGLAVDGVDELLDVFLTSDLAERPVDDLGAPVRLDCLDRPAAWLVTVEAGELVVRRGPNDGAAGAGVGAGRRCGPTPPTCCCSSGGAALCGRPRSRWTATRRWRCGSSSSPTSTKLAGHRAGTALSAGSMGAVRSGWGGRGRAGAGVAGTAGCLG